MSNERNAAETRCDVSLKEEGSEGGFYQELNRLAGEYYKKKNAGEKATADILRWEIVAKVMQLLVHSRDAESTQTFYYVVNRNTVLTFSDLPEDVYDKILKIVDTHEPEKGLFTTWLTLKIRGMHQDMYRRARERESILEGLASSPCREEETVAGPGENDYTVLRAYSEVARYILEDDVIYTRYQLRDYSRSKSRYRVYFTRDYLVDVLRQYLPGTREEVFVSMDGVVNPALSQPYVCYILPGAPERGIDDAESAEQWVKEHHEEPVKAPVLRRKYRDGELVEERYVPLGALTRYFGTNVTVNRQMYEKLLKAIVGEAIQER